MKADRWITLDRPEILNALYTDDLARIADAVTGIGASVRAIVLTGSGDRFLLGRDARQDIRRRRAGGRPGHYLQRPRLYRRGASRPGPDGRDDQRLLHRRRVRDGPRLRPASRPRRRPLRAAAEVRLGIPSVVEAALLYQYVGLSKAKEIIAHRGPVLSHRVRRPGPDQPHRRAGAVSGRDARTAGPDHRPAPERSSPRRRDSSRPGSTTVFSTASTPASEVFADVFRAPATATAIAQYQQARSRA